MSYRIIYHKRWQEVAFVLAAILLTTGCTNVVTKTWYAASQSGYPEQIGPEKIKPSFGIAFSGGGTRAAPAALGQLQALSDLGFIKSVNYISSVSGGTWAAVPYVFLPADFTDEEFLGAYIAPQYIAYEDLALTCKRSLANAISNAKFSLLSNNLYFSALKGKGDETFASYLGNIFLRPFNLKNTFPKNTPLYSREYFTTEDALKELLNQNKGLKESDFKVARKDRPFLIVNSTLMPFHSPNPDYFLPVEITPMYVGIPVKGTLTEKNLFVEWPKSTLMKEDSLKVGGYVEPLAYDSKLKKSLNGDQVLMVHANPVHGFSLSDVLAASGAAPQQILHRGGLLNALSTNLGFPEFVHWSVYDKSEAHKMGKEFAHGDGGHLDNLGIMPLLARQVDNILVFVNTPTPFIESSREISDDVASLFKRSSKYDTQTEISSNKPHNEVFRNEDYAQLLNTFSTNKREGKPLVHCQKYKVVENKRFNVREKKGIVAYEPNVCWIYLDRTQNWLNEIKNNTSLPEETKRAILYARDEFKHFPHYWTFFNDLPNVTVIDKSAPQVNLLANLTAWTVWEARKDIDLAFGTNLQALPRPLTRACSHETPDKEGEVKRFEVIVN